MSCFVLYFVEVLRSMGTIMWGTLATCHPHYFHKVWILYAMFPPRFSPYVLYLEIYKAYKLRLSCFVWRAFHVRCYT